MPKTDWSFDPSEYASVATRIALFYDRFPDGRIVTRLVSRADGEITFKALVYRTTGERAPAATGWAAERVGDGDVNAVACLENTETSAVGRALANLGFTASPNRPSLEEMRYAAAERTGPAADAAGASATSRKKASVRRPSPRPVDDALQARADAASDVLGLVEAAERAGMPPTQGESFRRRLCDPNLAPSAVGRLGSVLRRWLALREAEHFSALGSQSTTDPTGAPADPGRSPDPDVKHFPL